VLRDTGSVTATTDSSHDVKPLRGVWVHLQMRAASGSATESAKHCSQKSDIRSSVRHSNLQWPGRSAPGYASLYALPRSVRLPSSSSIRAHFPTVPVSLMGPNQAYRSTHSSVSRYSALVLAKASTCSFGNGLSLSQFVAITDYQQPTH